MLGVAGNLTAMLDDKFHRGKFDDITDKADAPIEEAVALMVRERLTGQAPPAAARKLVDLWRPHIEAKAGAELDRLEKLVENQRKFGDVIHDLLDSLEMGDERARDSEDENDDDSTEQDQQQQQGEEGESKELDDAEGMSMEEMEVSADEMPDGESEAMDAPSADMPDDADMGDSEASNEPWRPRPHGATSRAAPTTSRSRQSSTRPSRPKTSASPKNSTACAAISTSSFRTCRVSCRGSQTVCSAA